MKKSKQEPMAQNTELGLQPNLSKSEQEQATSSSNNEGQNFQVVENTPFYVGKLGNGKWSIGCGKSRVSHEFEDMDTAIAYTRDQIIDWQLVGIFIEEVVNQLKK